MLKIRTYEVFCQSRKINFPYKLHSFTENSLETIQKQKEKKIKIIINK